MSETNNVKITLVRSIAGRLPRHRATLEGLGLRKISQSVELPATPSVMGMVNQVAYLLKIETVSSGGQKAKAAPRKRSAAKTTE